MTRTTQTQLFLLALIFGFLAGPRVMLALQNTETLAGKRVDDVASVASPSVAEAEREQASVPISAYDTLAIDAKSVYVWDIKEHRILYEKNAHTQLPLASVTKMMMALVAVEHFDPNEQITIAPEDLREEGDNGLYAGENWSLAKLLNFTLVTSSNDGASAIASVIGSTFVRNATSSDPFTHKRLFIEQMNTKAQAIGLTDTFFANESGLDIDSVTGGAYGTARDMAILFEYIFRKHPELFTATTYAKVDIRSEDDIVHHVANTNEGVSAVSGLIGSKTGYTDLAGGNLVVLVDVGIEHPVVIAVLGSTRGGRFSDVDKLISATVAEITGQRVP